MEGTEPTTPEPPNAVAIASAFAESIITRWQVLLILLGLAWAAAAAAKAVQGMIFGFEAGAVMGVFGLDIVPTAFFAAAVAHAVLWDWRPGVRESLDVALKAFVTMLIILALYRLLFMIGLAFLFIPGLIIVFIFTFAPVLVMAQRPSIIQAFFGSFQIIKDHVPAMIAGYIVFFLACVGTLFVGAVVAGIATIGLSEAATDVILEAMLATVLSVLHITFAASAFKAVASDQLQA